MLLFGVLPAGVGGFVLGRITGDGHHSRIDSPRDRMHGDGSRWQDDNDNPQERKVPVPVRPGRPGVPVKPIQPTTPAAPNAS